MKNISTKYKLMALLPLFVLFGCERQGHKNVIVDKVVNGTKRMWKLSDVESGQERFFVYSRQAKGVSFYDYLEIGDTVSMVLIRGSIFSSRAYEKGFIFDNCSANIKYNADTIAARQKYELFSSLKHKTTKTR